MTTYAQIENGVARDILIVPAGLTINQMLHAELIPLFTEVPDGTVEGARQLNGAWVAPEENSVAANVVSYAHLTPMQFYLAFTPAERIEIKASTDSHVQEFLATMNLSISLNEMVDPNLVSVQEALSYLAQPTTATPPGPGILAATRIPQILQGIPQ